MTHKLINLLAFVLFCILSPITLLAHDFEAKNADGVTIYYNQISDTECAVTYYGTDIYSMKYCSNVTIPASVTYGDATFSVTSIGHEAFYFCYSLTSISLPNSLTTIDTEAFFYCYSLTSITLPEGITSIGDGAFCGCTRLSSISLPNTLTSISTRAFFNCTSLATITLPEGLTYIGDYAFSPCTSLTSITVDPANPNYSSLDGVLFNKDQSTLICYPGGKQGSYDVPNTVNYIGDYAIYSCPSLSSIFLPEGLTSIGDYAFLECTSLSSITLPEGLISIGDYAFRNCTSLTLIALPEGLASIGSSVFRDCTSLTSISFPESLTSIGSWAFCGCPSLTSISLPEGLTSIGDGAFYDCSSLATITLPEGLISIGDYAFGNCTSLTSISLPEGLTSIGDKAFENCASLTTVTNLAPTPQDISKYTFHNVSLYDKTLYVPAGSLLAYQSAPVWQAFGTILELEAESSIDQVTMPSFRLSKHSHALTLNGLDDGAEVYLYNLSGTQLGHSVAQAGSHIITLPATAPTGIYILRINGHFLKINI